MPIIYGLILLGVVLIGDSVSPIGQKPLWRQAALALTPATAPPAGADPIYQRQLEWQQARERRKAAALERQRQEKRQKALRSTKAYKTIQGYRMMRKMQRNQAQIGENFRMIRDGIANQHRR